MVEDITAPSKLDCLIIVVKMLLFAQCMQQTFQFNLKPFCLGFSSCADGSLRNWGAPQVREVAVGHIAEC